MIRMILTGCNWGTDEIEGGRQINIQDPKSEMLIHLPFTGDSLKQLIEQLAEGLTDEQKREVSPHFNGGVLLPPASLPPDIKRGPQG